ncbi:conserved hypothetical protein [Trichinella spiralis]|uniref:hypothetical protein n=1 Tax=Trichinella spiralis TaxID=6334 RepID=UPI0001EFE033|nr:conserved hypothetical protein [Trichinella spiralis]
MIRSFPPSSGSKNRKGIETRLSSGQPEESSLQRNSCRIHSRRRENKAMNPAENEPNVFRYTGNHFIVLELHAFETIVILSLVAMETAAIFPYSLQVLQFLFIDRLQCSKSFDAK